MKRILILTDSLGLPRNMPEMVEVHETWPQLLRNNAEVYQMSLGGATIEDIYKQAHYYTAFKPDLVIVQSGIVDCAPRALSRLENINLNSFWLTRGALSKLLPRYGKNIRMFRNKVYTPLPDFRNYALKFKNHFAPAPVFWVGIIPALPAYEAKLSGITDNIHGYNKVLKEIYQERFIDLVLLPAEGIMSDFHHLNKAGNRYLAEVLKKNLILQLFEP